jgi:negative regulator of sigma-B (phosphoserine phosphatase)
MKLAFDWVSLPKEGEIENGDAVLVRREGEKTLVLVVDALGHGAHAAQIARAAVGYAGSVVLDHGVLRIVEGLHAALKGTRGAAALVCVLGQGQIEACGVGNVEMRCQGLKLPVVISPGVLGAQVKRPRVFGGKLKGCERLVIFTDGVSSRFGLDALRDLSAAEACRAILAQHRRSHDDATVLVADLGVEQ